MDWKSINSFGESAEIWTTVVVNGTAILTGIIVAARWVIQRVEPTFRNVGQSALIGLFASIIFFMVGAAARVLAGHIWSTFSGH